LNEENDKNIYGVYGVKMCLNGIWKNIIVDDWLPTLNYKIVFSMSNGKFVWVPIIEKAFAKAHGSYKAMEGGNMDESMRILTGAPAFTIKIKDKNLDDLWRIIKRCFEKKYVLSCSVTLSKEESIRFK